MHPIGHANLINEFREAFIKKITNNAYRIHTHYETLTRHFLRFFNWSLRIPFLKKSYW